MSTISNFKKLLDHVDVNFKYRIMWFWVELTRRILCANNFNFSFQNYLRCTKFYVSFYTNHTSFEYSKFCIYTILIDVTDTLWKCLTSPDQANQQIMQMSLIMIFSMRWLRFEIVYAKDSIYEVVIVFNNHVIRGFYVFC